MTQDFIDADIATLTRVVDAPDPNTLGYGTDLSCVTDCTADFAEVDPNSPVGIAEAVVRRLTCPRGANPDDPDYGLFLPGYCNRASTLRDLQDLNGQISNELRKDDRIDDLTITISQSPADRSLSVSVLITPADPQLTQFSLTFSVTDADVLIDTITTT